jgi:hypothetical protein
LIRIVKIVVPDGEMFWFEIFHKLVNAFWWQIFYAQLSAYKIDRENVTAQKFWIKFPIYNIEAFSTQTQRPAVFQITVQPIEF